MTGRIRSSSSRPRASAAASPLGTPLLAAARALGVDIDSVCGGRGICGRCQVAGRRGRVRQARRALERGASLPPVARPSSATANAAALAGRPPAVLPGAGRRATSSSTCRPSSQVHRQVVRKHAEARDDRARTRSSACTTSRSREPDMHDPSGDLQRLCEALEREWQLTTSAATSRCCGELQARAARRATGRSRSRCTASRRSSRCGPASTTRPSASRSTSARPRSPATCATSSSGEVVASAGRDEPADPLRRRPDEPRLLRDDEPGRRARR